MLMRFCTPAREHLLGLRLSAMRHSSAAQWAYLAPAAFRRALASRSLHT